MGYKTYPEYRDSGVQWLGEVPAHWETRRLKYAAPLRNIKVVAGESDLPYIGLENIESWSGKYIVQDEANDSEGVSSRFYPGDVLFGKLRPYLAKAFLANFEGACSSELLVLQGKGVQPEFLVRFVLSVGFIREVDSSTYGAKMPRASWEFIGNLPVTLPPTEEQSTITAFLDEKTTQIDQLIEKKTRFIELLKEKRAALITEAVTGKFDVRTGKPYAEYKDSGMEWLGEVPAHWAICQQKRAWESSEYGISESIRDEGDIKILRMSCISEGKIDFDKSGNASSVDESLLLRKGDILFNRTNSIDQIAKAGLLHQDPERPTSYASYLVRMRVNRLMHNSYYIYAVNSKEFLEYARRNAIPAIGQANLSPPRYGQIRIPFPPIKEQKEITEYLQREVANIEEISEKTQQSIDLLKEKRAALITAAVTGKIDVRDFNPKR